MDTPSTSKQITIEVPADRVPEFYAFYGRFLAGRRRLGGRRGRPQGRPCRHRGEPTTAPGREPAA